MRVQTVYCSYSRWVSRSESENMRFRPAWMCIVLFAIAPQQSLGQDSATSSYGSEFYTGFMRNIGGTSLTKLQLTIGTPAAGAVTFKVEDSEGEIESGTVTSNAPVTVSIPNEHQITDIQFGNRNKGIRVSTEGDPLYVLVENSIFFVNHGTYLAYPCLSLGDDVDQYEYVVISVDDPNDVANSQFLLVGCEDDTTTTISPTQAISLPMNPQIDSELVTIDSGTTSHEIVLSKMQTLLVQSGDDLTGTKIVSNKPLTVLSGHECANIPLSEGGCEPLAVQVPPTATWGNTFLLAPFIGRAGPQAFKAVTASETTTFAYTCGSESRAAPNTKTLDFFTTEYCYLQSEDPIFVTQLSFGGSIDRKGDPTISMISPIDQYIKTIDFLSLPSSLFSLNYISVTVAAEHHSPENIRLDGHAINCEWQAISDNEENVVGYGCSKTVSPRRHTVSHSDEDGLLSVLVYGFNGFPSLGYSYLAGQAVKVSEDDDIDIDVESDFLSFLDLTTFPGTIELDNTQPDSTSEPIVIPDGLVFGDKIATLAYVNENGIISFNKPWKFSFPDKFPTDYFWTQTGLAVAPFWSDNDIRKEGTVRYATFHSDDAAANTKGRNWLNEVNTYIQSTQKEGEANFTGNWLLTVHWENVHPSPHGEDDHRGISEEDLEKANNYQTTIVTDIFRTYAVFSYKCGEIQWSSLGRNKAAVVGYNAEAKYFDNHALSGFPAVGDALSQCTFDIGKRRRRRQTVDDGEGGEMPNNMPMPLPADPVIVEKVGNCLNLVMKDRLAYVGSLETPESFAARLNPCPCTIGQAINDHARFIRMPGNNNCYISAQPVELPSLVLTMLGLTQMCCYSNGALEVSQNEGFAGTFLLFHPIMNEPQYEECDQGFRQACCEIGFDDRYYCSKYFERRIISDCQPPRQYNAPVIGHGQGDPHYRTFDSRYYDFQGDGEFILLKVLPETRLNTDTCIFTLQGRMRRWSPTSRVSVHITFAFGRPGLAFECNANGQVYRTQPGPPEDITNQLPWKDNNTELRRSDTNSRTIIVSYFESGIILQLDQYSTYMNFRVFVPRTYANRVQGFLGNLDGNPSNEFHTRESTTPEPNVNNEQQIYDHLQQHWKLKDSDERFFHTNQRRRRRRQDNEFVPIFFDELEISKEVEIACEGNRQCILDLIITGDIEVAMNALNHEKQTNTTRAEIENFPPNISADAILSITIGQESSYNIVVVDNPGDDFSLMVLGGLPPNSALEPLGGGEYVFRWNLQEVTTEPLTFIATDSMNASSTFVPIVEICACVNGGECTREGLLSSNATVVLNCKCTEAFSGTFCEEDRNGCSEIQCFEGVECMDIPAPGVGAVCGSCPEGYTGDTLKCYDIDECALTLTNCKQYCNNTDGSYFCDCFQGYRIQQGSISECEDINECNENLDGCQQRCVNSIGSYSCACEIGFTLDENGRTCTANLPCVGGGGCSHICAVIGEEARCFCPIGYELLPEGQFCVDINECLGSPCGQLCTNTLGSFECSCREGYSLLGNGRSCEDRDECTVAAFDAIDLCENDTNTRCLNNEGSFQCICVPGYSRINGTCQRTIEKGPIPRCPSVPPKGIESSLSFISPTLTLTDFTPDRQQLFRRITAAAVTSYCSKNSCTLIVLLEVEPKTIERPRGGIQAQPQNVAIPSCLVSEDENGQLNITFYIQLSNGFLATMDLTAVIEENRKDFQDGGFLQQAPFPPTDVRGFCDVVVWSLLVQPGGEIFAYDIRLYVPDTEQAVVINLGKVNFYVLKESQKFTPETSMLVQVRGINAVGTGEWSSATTLGCMDPPTIQPTTCPEPLTCPECPTCAMCPTCETCPTAPPCPTCETCPTQPPCPTCETAPPCPTCETAPPCPTCETCPTQPPCPTCETAPPCPTCETVPPCSTCETCPTQPPCPTCETAPPCPTCETCPTQPPCPTCETAPPCPTCETCPSPITFPTCPDQPPCPTVTCETPPPCPTCNTCPTQPPCPTCETCPAQPVCPTCSCPPCVDETEPPIPAIHFQLQGRILRNNSEIALESVGRTNNALLCITDRLTCCGNPFRAGQFYFPGNVPVPNMAAGLGFWRGRGLQMVRLNRRETATSPRGIYRCEVPDSSGTLQNIYITLA